jgi:hypothetical protein
MIILKARAVCDGHNWNACEDKSECEVELLLGQEDSDVRHEQHLTARVRTYPDGWYVSGENMMPMKATCPACITKEEEYKRRATQNIRTRALESRKK